MVESSKPGFLALTKSHAAVSARSLDAQYTKPGSSEFFASS